MSSFLIDTLVEASDTNLQAHTPNTGGAWKKIGGFWNARVTGGAGYAETYNYDGDQARYASDTTPLSADWGIRASHKFIGTPGYDPFLTLYCRDDMRSAATAEWYTSYEFKVSKSGAWTLGWRDGSNVYTSISTGSVSALGNTDHKFELDAVGTTITAKIDGSTVYTGTDTNVSIVGVASIRWADGQLNWIQAGNPADADPEGGIVITGPSGTPTGPTQATIACSTDTSGVNLYHLILPAATAAPADAAALIADIAAVSHTVSATGAQSYNITGLTTNTAVKVHFAQTGSNVSSSASFTPNTLAIAGTALSAQTGTAGAAFTWTGATPESLLTNTGNGSGSWTATAGVGASGVTVNSSTGILVSATLGVVGSYAITLQRTDGSTVPSAQTVTKSVGLTISSSGPSGGTLLLDNFKLWTGTTHTSITVPFVKVCGPLPAGDVLLELTDQAVNSGGDMTLTNASLNAGDDYVVFGFNADGTLSFKKTVTAS